MYISKVKWLRRCINCDEYEDVHRVEIDCKTLHLCDSCLKRLKVRIERHLKEKELMKM